MAKFSFVSFLAFAAVSDAFVQQQTPRSFIGRSALKAASSDSEVAITTDSVNYLKTTHMLHYVDGIEDIPYEDNPPPGEETEEVEAFQLTNNMGVTVKAMARGANLVELSIGGDNYVWENIEGGCYYGGNSNNFPLKRGLVLNGGVRFAAVTAEHGLYYDIDWNPDLTQCDGPDSDSKSIIFTIQDNDTNRLTSRNLIPAHPANPKPALDTGFSNGQFNHNDINGAVTEGEMTRYPTTDLTYEYKITLNKDEDFVRLRMSVKNEKPEIKWAEAWLPMTFPVNEDSIILSEQKLRWRRDNWCFDYNTPNVVTWDNHPDFDKPLSWPTGGIFYDFPRKDGLYHGVTTKPEEGKGIVYYAPDDPTGPGHYTKMWAWGVKGDNVNDLTEGRPASEYYEPWSSGTNFAFFQTSEFEPHTEVSWEIALLPIPGALTGTTKEALKGQVDQFISDRAAKLSTVQGIKTESI